MTTKPKTKPGPPASPAAAVVPPQSEGIMPQQIVPVTLEETWKLLRPGIVEVFERQPMSVKRYMALFNNVYNYCTSPMYFEKCDSSYEGGGYGMELLGAKLYRLVHDYLKDYIKKLTKGGHGKHDECVLTFYSENWSSFTISSKVVHHMFMYLNKHWVRRVTEDGKRSAYEIYNLALVTWRDILLTDLQKVVTKAAMMLIERERNGDTINTQFIKLVVDSYVELGVHFQQRGQDLQYYKKAFEGDLLLETKNYYINESMEFLRQNSVAEYLKKAEGRLIEENQRVQRYLHEGSMQSLIQLCEDALITAHLDAFYEDFQLLLDNDKNDDMDRMYRLVARTKNGLIEMQKIAECHIKKQGLQAIESCGEVVLNDSQMYVQAILDIYKKYNALVLTSFHNDRKFMEALDRACEEFINKNYVTTKNENKSPQLIAHYCNFLLKKSTKMVEEAELEDILSQIMVVFRYLKMKDAFEKVYSVLLARRLVEHTSVSDDAEAGMISKLKEACGYTYTEKLQKMFQDIELNKNLNERFKEHSTHLSSEPKVEFYIDVITHGSWPFYITEKFALPKELDSCIHQFSNFYAAQHSGRKLTWLYDKSRGDIVTMGFKKRYTLQASTYQIAVLMQYNYRDTYTFEQLKDNTQIDQVKLQQVLRILLKIRLLMCSNEAVNDKEEHVFAPTSVFDLYLDYKNKKLRVNINTPLSSEVKQEQESTDKSIDGERKMHMEAVIVRIMKMRQTLKHIDLWLAVVDQLRARFIPTKSDMKRVIGGLIERDYLARLPNQTDTYVYRA